MPKTHYSRFLKCIFNSVPVSLLVLMTACGGGGSHPDDQPTKINPSIDGSPDPASSFPVSSTDNGAGTSSPLVSPSPATGESSQPQTSPAPTPSSSPFSQTSPSPTPSPIADLTLYDRETLETEALSPNWSCSGFTYDNDVWVRTYYDGVEQFDFRIGPGGVIAELRDTHNAYTALLSPSYKGEPTDRVIQWTWWSNSLVNVLNTLPDYEWRFNVTQAGTFESVISPSYKVDIHNNANCLIDVYSQPQNQWKSEQESAMQGRFTARTRYAIAKDGAIIIRRTLLVGESYLFGQPSPLSDEYLEAWTPFSRAQMESVAYSVGNNGAPDHWYQAGNNLPSYAFLDVKESSGYAVAFKGDAPASSPAVGLVFGVLAPCYHNNTQCAQEGSYALNLMEWDTGVGVLPGLTLPNILPGDMVDSYIVLQPSHGVSSLMKNNLDFWVDKIPAPKIIRSDAELGENFTRLKTTLELLEDLNGSRVIHLAPLVAD